MKKFVSMFLALVMCLSLSAPAWAAETKDFTKQASEGTKESENDIFGFGLELLLAEINENPITFKDVSNDGGCTTREYCVTLESGEVMRSSITVQYINSDNIARDYIPNEGEKDAPSVGSSIRITWHVADTVYGPGMEFISTIKRTGTNTIEATNAEIHVIPQLGAALQSSDAWIGTVNPKNAARTRARFTMETSVSAIYSTYELTADFVMENGVIGYYMWQN